MKYLLCFLWYLPVLSLSSQQDSIPLQYEQDSEIIIQDTRRISAPLYLSYSQSFGEQIADQSSLYIRSYGKGSLASLSHRGGTSQQTQLQWDGLPIHNPMLGLADLSLVSSPLFSKAVLHSGGQSTFHGSGAICGVLEVKQDTATLGGELGISVGSFGARTIALGHRWSWGKFDFSAKGTWELADNDFTHFVGKDTLTQTNADFDSKGLLVSAGYNLKEGQLKLSYWLQDIHRGIPPTTVQNRSEARQEDYTQRLRLDLRKKIGQQSLRSVLAYMDENNNFEDLPNAILARNSFKKWVSQSTLTRHTATSTYSLKVDLNHTIGNTKNYQANQNTLSQAGLYLSAHRDLEFIDIKAAIRSEWNNLVSPPLLPSLELTRQLNRTSIQFKLSREYRVPGLNDLFWTPGGNPDLRPEIGWNQELTLTHKYQRFKADATIYHRKINDWILWLPSSETGFFSAINIAEVRSTGIECKAQLSGQYNKFLWQWTAHYHYGQSTHLNPVPTQRIEAGDQLIYTPRHTFSTGINFQRGPLTLNLNNRYTSSVKGINVDVDGYWLSSLRLEYERKYKIKKRPKVGKISFGVLNLFNHDYRVIERRPMPGRNYDLQWTFNF